MQIKNTIKYYFTLLRVAIIKRKEKKEKRKNVTNFDKDCRN